MFRSSSFWFALSVCLPSVLAGPIPVTQGPPRNPAITSITVPTDGTWIVLDELMTAGMFYAPIFTYTSATAVQLDVTDLFVVSDQNEVYLNAGFLGATPPMPDWQALFPVVGPLDDPPYTPDPDVAWSRPEFSKASFALPAGTNILTLRNIHIPLNEDNMPFPDGTVAFRIVPEPASAALLLALAAIGLRPRRKAGARRCAARGGVRKIICVLGALCMLHIAVPAARAAPCGPLQAGVVSGVLEIQGTPTPDSIRVKISSASPVVVEIYSPVTAAVPSCSFDSVATPFQTIRVTADDGDDLVVFDDSAGPLSSSWAIIVDGGGGEDVVFGGINLSMVPLGDAMSMIATLQQARDLLERVLDLLDASPSGCGTVPCLVTNTAAVVQVAAIDLVMPTVEYVRDIESELVQPAAATVRKARDRIATHLQTTMAGGVEDLSREAQTFSANVEVQVADFELLLPVAEGLLVRAQTLYDHAANLGLAPQEGGAVTLFMQTMESHILSINEFADLCAEDPEPTETQADENLQDPSGLPTFCAEVERRIEALEATVDSVEARTDLVEAEGDTFEGDGDALALSGEGLGDDENPSSAAAQMETEGDNLVSTADLLSASADALNADWEQWVGQAETNLETSGTTMHTRGQTEVMGAADTLETRTHSDIRAAAAVIRNEAHEILSDLDALISAAGPLMGESVPVIELGIGCGISPTNEISGGAGGDLLIGSIHSDLIEGGDGDDLLIGGAGADQLLGDDGNDLIFGGGAGDEINGGAKTDILVGNRGADCIFGGGGQTLTRGSLSIELGDLFFGNDGDDRLVSGDSDDELLTEVDVAFGGDGNDRVRLSHGGTLTVGSFSFQFGNLVFGSAGADEILTRDGLDVIFGGADNDRIATAKGAALAIGSGSSAVRLGLGDLIFGDGGDDVIDSDDPDADRADDDIDVIFGGAGDDTINGYGGALLSVGDASDPDFELQLGNLIFGRGGEDQITTLDGVDVIFGGDDNDTILAGKGAPLTIGSGSNEFRLALGDLIFGGDGDDQIDGDDPQADRADDDIDVAFGGGGADEIHGYGGGLLSIGDVSDPDFELRLGNVIFGGDDDDTIDALDGIDLIFAGAGDDTASAGKGHNLNIDDDFMIDLGDLMFGQDGDDKLHGDAADPPSGDDEDGIDVIFGGADDDSIFGGTGGSIEVPDQDFCLLFGNLLFGGPGNDALRGDYENWDAEDPRGGIDLIFGAGGDDTIEGAAGSLIVVGDITAGQAIIIWFGNLLFGGPDNDMLRGADASDLCSGVNQDLDDLLSDLGVADLGGSADLIFCGSGNDTVDAYDGIDFVFGGDGDDVLRGDHGGILIVPISGVPTPIAFGNLMFGADGEDSITSLGRLLLPTVPPMEIDLLFGGPCDDNISAGDGLNLAFGGKANDIIVAGDGVNLLFGNSGDDDVTAGSGLNVAFGNRDNDSVTGGEGVNVLFGNRGDDMVTGADGLNVAFGNKDADLVRAGAGVAILFGNAGPDEVEGGNGLSLAFGNRGDDVVRGGNGLAVLFGNAGNDDVAGAVGLNVAFGNADHDLVGAGAGLAALFGNAGEDRVRSGSGLSVSFGNRDRDILQAGGGGLYIAFGNLDDDVVVGGGGLNLNFGNRGDDQFFGGGVNLTFGNRENDIIRGGGSADFLFGNAGSDQVSGAGAKDFIFGNRDDDSLVSDGTGDFLFGNRGNDVVRSGGDSSDRDYLFGNRGNDNLFGCSNADKLFGGRGSDNKDRNDCNGLSLPAPARGEVRGTVLIDLDGDGSGDVGQAGVSVSAGSSTGISDADGNYRIAGLAVGTHSVTQTAPAGFVQISLPPAYSVTVGSMGIDLFQNRDFVNREQCFVSPDAWSCLGESCLAGPGLECRPLVVQRVMRCPETGEVCDANHDCPCDDCVPSWAVVECGCVDPATDCYITITSAGPECGTKCLSDDGTAHSCELVNDGDFYRCECGPPPCPTELARFRFSGIVTNIGLVAPSPPWDQVQVGEPWSITYWFVRGAADQDPSPPIGDYPAIVFYQLQIGAAVTTTSVPAGSTLIRNTSGLAVSPDAYDVSIPVNAGGPPPPGFLLHLLDQSGTAWLAAGLNPRDALPLCDDIVLDRFGVREFSLTSTQPGNFWQINGSVLAFNCTDCAPPPELRPLDKPGVPLDREPARGRR